MHKNTFLRFIIVFLLILPLQSFCEIVLNDSIDLYKYTYFPYEFFEDTSGLLSPEDVIENHAKYFYTYEVNYPKAEVPTSVYWMKFDVINHSQKKAWIFELFNNRLDNVELFYKENNKLVKMKMGDLKPFWMKAISHKNFTFLITFPFKEKKSLYVRVKSINDVDLYGELRSPERFISYSLKEYMLLGLLYGFIGFILLYNVIIYFYFRSKIYIYYFLYVLSFGLYTSSMDGIAFQFLWPHAPWLNNIAPAATLCSFIVFEMLFAQAFNRTKKYAPWLSKFFSIYVLFRILYFLLSVLIFRTLLNIMVADVISFFIIGYSGFVAFKKGHKISLFFLTGVGCFFLGFMTTNLMHVLMIIPHTVFTVYALDVGIICEMIVFSICLAYSFRDIKNEKDIADLEIQVHKKEVEQIEKQKVTLEKLVEERTKEIAKKNEVIEERNKDLDNFLYKSSHNLRGPLKTIEGLCRLGNRTIDANTLNQYLTLINKTVKDLDKDLQALGEISEISRIDPNYSVISFRDIAERISEVSDRIILSDNYNFTFKTDLDLISKVIKNLIIAGFKFQKGKGLPLWLDFNYKNASYSIELKVPVKELQIKEVDELIVPFNINLISVYDINLEIFASKLLLEKLNHQLLIKQNDDMLIFQIGGKDI